MPARTTAGFGPGILAKVTAQRRSIAWEAVGCTTLILATVVAARGPLFRVPLSTAVVIALFAALVGLGTSVAQGRSGPWSGLAVVSAPVLAVPVAAGVESPGVRAFAAAGVPLAILGAAWWQRRLERTPAWLSVLVALAAWLTVMVDLAFRDPYRELNCTPVCPVSPWVIEHNPRLVTAASWVLLGAVGAFLIAAVSAIVREHRDRSTRSSVQLLLISGVMAAGAAAQMWRPEHRPGDPVMLWSATVQFACAVAAAMAALEPVFRSYLGRRRVHEWIATVESAARGDGVVQLLRVASGDPQLRFIDSADPSAGRVATTIHRDGQPIGVVEHRREALGRLEAALSPMVVAMVENDRLVHLARRQLDELQAARRLAIERIDRARSELQRDLHDGAQQHLIALGMELSMLAADAPDSARTSLERAAQHASDALERLRAVSHGQVPPVLDTEGLQEALRSLAEDSPVDLELQLPAWALGRHPPDVERAVYRLVLSSIHEAAAAPAGRLRVRLEADHGLVVTTSHDAGTVSERIHDIDRVEAAGGSLSASVEGGHAVYRARFA